MANRKLRYYRQVIAAAERRELGPTTAEDLQTPAPLLAKELRVVAGVQFERQSGSGRLVAMAGNSTCFVDSAQEMSILGEIYLNGIYNFTAPGECVVLDIGMNVGLASLYFAQMPSVRAVYGYEPFEPTYRLAIQNFAINTELREKLVPNNFGVAAQDEELTVPYSASLSGSVSIRSVVPELDQNTLTQERISVRSASEIVRTISSKHGDCSLVVKLDCEGSEYEIIEALAAAGLLRDVCLFMIEWHRDGPCPLQKTLNANGFGTIAADDHQPNNAMLYAMRI